MSEAPDLDSAIVGLCPKCHSWFLCDAWFDQTVPLPCCDSCRLPPVKLAYVGQPRGGTPEDGDAGIALRREACIAGLG